MTAPKVAPKVAMVLAAGIGSRMRPLTDTRPKALVEVAGKALIDHTLDRLAKAGVERAVVNVHHFADQMQAHLSRRATPVVTLSDERSQLLDSGGGIAHARELLGDDPVFVANIDNVWIERGAPALGALAQAWDPDATCLALGYPDALLLCRLRPSLSAFASLPLQATLLTLHTISAPSFSFGCHS